MKYIYRPKYINEIKKYVDKPIIKILTGMRRVGKSTILEMIKDELKLKNNKDNIISINFESLEFIDINNDKDLNNYLKPLLKKINNKGYLFFDEIQLVNNWERVINGLRLNDNLDIYITGSNSTLISGELSTLLAGRYIQFEIQPLTFIEFKELFNNLNLSNDDLFNKFIKIGGMPFLKYFNLEESSSYKYLSDVYNTVLVKDVLEYNKIRDVDIFNRILRFIIENIGHTFSANNIRKYFKSENRNVSLDTILNYLQYCENAFIIKKIKRYDTVGKKILKLEEKYYLSDHGFRSAIGFSNIKDIERTLENIILIELISRGYNISIGKVNNKEIDFIAKKQDNIKYFQVSYLLESLKTRNREFNIYNQINDNYPKYVLSMDKIDFSQNGIIHKNIIDFLLEK